MFRTLLFTTLVSSAALSAQAAEPSTPLTLTQANAVIARAMANAESLKAPGGAIAVVDAGGAIVSVQRLDGTFAASAGLSIGKARTAAAFQKPTSALEQSINGGRAALLTLTRHGYTPLQGGVPLMIDGRFVGAIGVSGAASAAQDEAIANAAALVPSAH